MLVVVPVLWVLMPVLIGLFYGRACPACDDCGPALARRRRRCGSIWGWTKSFPVSIGQAGAARDRAGSRDRVLRARCCSSSGQFGRDGRRGAMVVATVVLLPRSGRSCSSAGYADRLGDPVAEAGMKVVVVSGIWPPDVGGPASHAPEVCDVPARPRPRGRGGDHGRRAAPRRRPTRFAGCRGALPVGVAPRCSRRADRACRAAGRRRLHDRHVRRIVARRGAARTAARRQADGRPRLRALAPLGALSRHLGGVPARTRTQDRAAAPRARPRAGAGRARRRPAA